jgi:hypothetical protein
MSVATAELGLIENSAVRGERPDGGVAPRGVALSVALHLVLGTLLILGMPRLFDPPIPEEMPVVVQLVTIASETRATRPNPTPPRPNAKPEPPIADAPVTKPTPEPAAVVPVPPPSAELPPSPEPPKPPEPKPVPPPMVKPPEPKPEAPKLIAKAEPPPKPKEKPDPPQQTAKSEPKTEPKKYDPGQFEALLKNLAAPSTALSPDPPPQKARIASARPSSQPRAPLGAQLTASEMDLIREQIARCWNVPAGARDAKDLVVEIRVAVDPDGTVRQATIVDQARVASDPFFRAAAESARRAFFNPLCRPLHLPADKYAIWKDLVVDFSPRDIL